MSIWSSIKSALTGKAKIKTYTSNTVGGQKVAALNAAVTSPKVNTATLNFTPTKSIIGNSSALNNMSIGGVTTPNISKSLASSVPYSSLNAPAKASLSTGAIQGPKIQSGGSTSGGSTNISSLTRSGVSAAPVASSAPSIAGASPSMSSVGGNVTPVSTLSSISGATSSNFTPPSASNFTGYDKGSLAVVGMNPDGTIKNPEEKQETDLQKILKELKGEDIPRMDTQQAREDSGYNDAVKTMNDIGNQISAITARKEANLMQLRGTGAAEGVTEAVYGGQQAQIEREAAIKLMPLTAMYQAAKGNVEAAQQIVSDFMADERDYQNRVYQWKNNLYDKAWDLATSEQKTQIEDRRNAEKRQQELEDDFRNRQEGFMKTALESGQGYLVDSLRKAKNDDELYATATKISGGGSAEIDRVIDINGVATPIDKFGNVITIKGGTQTTPTNELIMAGEKQNIDNIEQLLTSGGMSTAVGTNILSRSPRGVWGTIGKIATVVGIPGLFKDAWKGATGQRQDFIAGVEQLQSQLSLDSLINAKAKGATFGALSDTEMRILSASASKIGSYVVKDEDGNAVGYNTTEANFQKELNKINNFAKLDYLLKGGNLEDVGAIQTPDGAVYVKNYDGTLTKLR
jgi:hypothetical protein